ncbi:MAG: GreA/GreB family elongation factor [Bacteroidales bacterium]|nr:GreA/GreB family elongation factor [Bacteroidales bacterium]
MSRGFVKEGDQEEVPMVLPRAFLPQGVPNYVTPEGLVLLNEEMENLKKERAEAASNYIQKNYIDAKMRQLSERITAAVLIDPTKANPDVVSFGSYVKFNDKVVRIVGVDEADASKGLISFVSPIAKALIGKKKGDRIEVKLPRGVETVEIQGVFESYELRAMSREQRAVTELVEVTESYELPSAGSGTNMVTELVEVTESYELPSTGSGTNTVTELVEVTGSYELPSTGSGTNTVTELVEVTESSSNSQKPMTNSQQSKFKPENNPTDFLPIVNERGNIMGRALYCEAHNGNKVLHPAVHLIVFNSKNEIVGKYCWHVGFGETAEKTIKRNVVDITSQSIKPKLKKQYIREDKNEKELVSVFTAISDGELLPSPDNREYEMMFEKD